MNFVQSIAGLNKCPICGASRSSMANVDDVVTLRKGIQCYECGSIFTDIHTHYFLEAELSNCPFCHQKGVTEIILPNGEKANYCVLCKESFSSIKLPESEPITNPNQQRAEEFDSNIRPMIDGLKNYVRRYEDMYFCEQLQSILHNIVDFVEGK